MKNSKSKDSRRKLLKIIATGGGAVVVGKSLPENWARPVVDAVVLPVHAQTSPPASMLCSIPAGCYTLINNNTVQFPGGTEGDLITGVVPVFSGAGCTGQQIGVASTPLLLATIPEDAAAFFGIVLGDVREFILTDPPAGSCRLFFDNS